MKRLLIASLAVAAITLTASTPVLAQFNPLITVDEQGNGTLLFPGGGPIPTVGVLAPDPGPGGLAAALTYNLLGPPALVAGDVLLLEPGSLGTVSDIIRFNPAGTGGNPAYPASLVFYSDTADSGEVVSLADTGFPTALYTNNQVVREVIVGSGHQATYTPGANDPGFVPGFSVSYVFNSSTASVPEPSSLALSSIAGVTLAAVAGFRRRRKSATA